MLCGLVLLISGFSFKTLHNCTNYFSCCDKILDRSRLSQERFMVTEFLSITLGKVRPRFAGAGARGRGSPHLDGLGDRAGLWPTFNDPHPRARPCIPKIFQPPETKRPAGDQMVRHRSAKSTFLLHAIIVTTGSLAHAQNKLPCLRWGY